MMEVEEILKTALYEYTGGEGRSESNYEDLRKEALETLRDPRKAPLLGLKTITSVKTDQARVVRFRCMVQDTSYPPEVYMPPPDQTEDERAASGSSARVDNIDWSKLRERWVAWAVEIPGEQGWASEVESPEAFQAARLDSTIEEGVRSLNVNEKALAEGLAGKFPVPARRSDYVGALLKVYDSEISFKPGTTYIFTGILSTSTLPISEAEEHEQRHRELEAGNVVTSEDNLVPCIHVIAPPSELYTPSALAQQSQNFGDIEADRSSVIQYLARYLHRDDLAAEFLLMALLATVISRGPGDVPLGNLSLNLLLPKSAEAAGSVADSNSFFAKLISAIQAINPVVQPLELTLDLLGKELFFPSVVESAVGSSETTRDLHAGLLQLPPTSIVLVNEDTLASGTLQDRGVKNLKCLADVVKHERLRYEFPFVAEDFGMDVDLGFVVVGQGKSLLPVDVHVPLAPAAPASTATASSSDLNPIRKFMMSRKSEAAKISIPDDVADFIQNDWVRLRKEGGQSEGLGVSEDDLARWLRMGRLLALSYPDKAFTREIWSRTVDLDFERRKRMVARA